MANARSHSVRRAISVAAFITALILLTGTPARIRAIVLSHEAPGNGEYRVAAQ